MSKTPKKKTPKSDARVSVQAAPAIVRHLIARFLDSPDHTLIERAHREASRILDLETLLFEPQHNVAAFIEEAAKAELTAINPALMESGSDCERYAGDVQIAFGEPSFCLGFALAYQLFADRGGVRCEDRPVVPARKGA